MDVTTRDRIKAKIDEFTAQWGGFENIALLREAYHACDPRREFGWRCDAVRIDGNQVEFGVVSYDWSFTSDFESQETYDLNDEDDLDDVLTELNKW